MCTISFKVFVTMLFLIQAWFFGQEACGILASRPGIEPGPAAVGGEVLTNRLPGKSLQRILKVIPLFIYSILIAPGSPSRRTGFSPPCISHFEASHFRAWAQDPVCPLAVAHGAQLLCGTWDLPRPGTEPCGPCISRILIYYTTSSF